MDEVQLMHRLQAINYTEEPAPHLERRAIRVTHSRIQHIKGLGSRGGQERAYARGAYARGQAAAASAATSVVAALKSVGLGLLLLPLGTVPSTL